MIQMPHNGDGGKRRPGGVGVGRGMPVSVFDGSSSQLSTHTPDIWTSLTNPPASPRRGMTKVFSFWGDEKERFSLNTPPPCSPLPLVLGREFLLLP